MKTSLKTAAVLTMAVLILLAVLAPVIWAQGGGLSRNVFQWVIAKQLTVDGYIVERPVMLRFQDVKDDTGGNVLAETAITTGTTSITSSITNPDYPRNLQITLAQVSTSALRTAGNVVITGVDARGFPRLELLAVTAISATEYMTGSVPFATITSFQIPAQGHAISVTVSLGKKFALPKTKLVATSDVYFFTANNTYSANVTVDADNATFAPASVSADDDYTVWFKQ